MAVAIAALAAAAAVIFALSGITTTPPTETLLGALLSQRHLSPEEASTILAYSVFVYLVGFSVALFALRVLSYILALLGIPNEDQVRHNRSLRRDREARLQSDKTQARLIGHYLLRAQQMVSEKGQAQQQSVRPTSKTVSGDTMPMPMSSKPSSRPSSASDDLD